jgi:hypothetical protein
MRRLFEGVTIRSVASAETDAASSAIGKDEGAGAG